MNFITIYFSYKWNIFFVEITLYALCSCQKNVNIQFQKLYSSSDEKASFSLKHYVECLWKKWEKREKRMSQKKLIKLIHHPLVFCQNSMMLDCFLRSPPNNCINSELKLPILFKNCIFPNLLNFCLCYSIKHNIKGKRLSITYLAELK